MEDGRARMGVDEGGPEIRVARRGLGSFGARSRLRWQAELGPDKSWAVAGALPLPTRKRPRRDDIPAGVSTRRGEGSRSPSVFAGGITASQ